MANTMLRVLVVAAAVSGTQAVQTESRGNPIRKVVTMLQGMAEKVTAEGKKEQDLYDKFMCYCKTGVDDLAASIDAAETKVEELTASIEEAKKKYEQVAGNLDTDKQALADAKEAMDKATAIREKEAADFGGEEKEMMQAVDALGRAVKIIKDEMSKGSSFAQIDTSNMQTALMGLGAVLDAAAFSTQDREKLVALAQTSEDSDDEELGAPAAAAHKSQSGGILDVLEDMEGKAEEELGALRKAEVASRNNYEMLKQGLDDKIANDNKDLANQKSDKAGAEEAKATAQGELEATVKALAQATKELETAQSTCMTVAKDHEMSIAARNEELKVIAQAKKILEEAASGADRKSVV